MLAVRNVQINRRGQAAAVACSRRDGARIHQRHAAQLPLARLGALSVGEIARGMADGQFAVGGRIARAEARAAEALAHDGPGCGQIAQHAVAHQLLIGRHAVRIHAEAERAVADGTAAQDISRGTQVIKDAARAAGDYRLLHPHAAVVHLADQIDLRAADLGVHALLAVAQDINRIGQQRADGHGVAGMHRQGDHAFNLR